MKKGILVSFVLGTLLLMYPISSVRAVADPPRQVERITYFSSEGTEQGLWLFNPMTTERELLFTDLTGDYKFSPDGHYLAFLVNNYDRGMGKSNTVSLWVRNLTNGIEQAVVSAFDTDSNIDAQYRWMANGELAVIQITEYGERKITLYRPDGGVSWTTPKEYQYIAHNAERILLRDRKEETLSFYHLLSQRISALPVSGLIINASISPQGNYLSYQTLKEIILLNIHNGERVYIDVGELSGVEFGWSAEETFLVFQSRKRTGEEEFYQLAVFNVETGMKEFEVNSENAITYSWSSDEKQMVFSMYRNGWNVMVWFPEQYNTRSIQTALAEQPIPRYQKQTHEFIYLTYVEETPRIYSYDVDVNILKLVHAGNPESVWQNIEWVPTKVHEVKRTLHKMYIAGKGEVKRVQFIRHLKTAKSEYDSILKWAPGHRTLVLKEDEQTLTLIDATGKAQQFFSGTMTGEPFWNQDGSHLAFIQESDPKELILYNAFRGQATKYPLLQEKYELTQWMEDRLWLFDGRLTRFFPLGNEWTSDAEWRDFWWGAPKVQPAHYRAESLWQLGANIWLRDWEGHFRVLTRLPINMSDEWEAHSNSGACWSPDDEQILYERQLSQGTERFSQIWVMDREGGSQRYLCEGEEPKWYGNHRFLFLRDGDLHLASIGSEQIIVLDTPELTELAFMVSYDSALIAVVARDRQEKVGLYLFEVQ